VNAVNISVEVKEVLIVSKFFMSIGQHRHAEDTWISNDSKPCFKFVTRKVLTQRQSTKTVKGCDLKQARIDKEYGRVRRDVEHSVVSHFHIRLQPVSAVALCR